MLDKIKLLQLFAVLSTLILLGSMDLYGYTPWEDNSSYGSELGKAKIRIRFQIREVDVYPITQNNCIFRQMEDRPNARTSPNYRQPHCASLRNQRVEASERHDMPAGTKITRVPANAYFKIEMEVGQQMSNRIGEEFGLQIIDAETKKTAFLQGGWKPGDKKQTKAIKLKPGRYYWRCPVNPTPWYGLIAE